MDIIIQEMARVLHRQNVRNVIFSCWADLQKVHQFMVLNILIKNIRQERRKGNKKKRRTRKTQKKKEHSIEMLFSIFAYILTLHFHF